MKKNVGRLAVVLVVALAMVGLVWAGFAMASGPGEPDPGTVVGIGIRTFYATPLTGTGTVQTTLSRDMHVWRNLDVFVTLDISGTGYVTVTPQVSADNTNFVTATYNYQALSYATTVTATTTSTSTATTTSTVSLSDAVTEATYQIALTADGTDYLRMPMAGYYLRFNIAYSGTVTPVVRAVARND